MAFENFREKFPKAARVNAGTGMTGAETPPFLISNQVPVPASLTLVVHHQKSL